MDIAFSNLKNPEIGSMIGQGDDYSDEKFKYELMWTGFSHKPAPEHVAQLKELGLLFADGTTPTIRKANIEKSCQDGTGVRWYIENKNWRTLGMMEKQLGMSSQGMSEFYGYGRPAKPLNERYGCLYCTFVAGSQIILDAHMSHEHPKELQMDIDARAQLAGTDLGEAPKQSKKCVAMKTDGSRCTQDAIDGSAYCNHPAHQKLTEPVKVDRTPPVDTGVTTTENSGL